MTNLWRTLKFQVLKRPIGKPEVPTHEVPINMDMYWDYIEGNVKKPENVMEDVGHVYKFSHTLCVPFNEGNASELSLTNLVEFVEFTIDQGVEKIIFYVSESLAKRFSDVSILQLDKMAALQ